MTKKLLLFITMWTSFVFIVEDVRSQSVRIVEGAVVDSLTGLGIQGATIIFQGNKITIRKITNEEGKFSIQNVEHRCLIIVSAKGYSEYKDSIVFEKDQNSLRIVLHDSSVVLSEIKVSSKKIITEAGKTTFLVNATDIRTSSTVLDLLSKTPYLSVETDGAVKIRGKTNAEIYLDGKILMDSKVLTSLPPKAIQKIEIISNPGASSDIEGQKGIVNIVTKKNWDGYFGNLSGQLGTNRNDAINTFFSTKGRRIEFNFSGGINYYKKPFDSDLRWSNLSMGNSFSQSVLATNQGLNSYLTSGINIQLDSLSKISYKGFIAWPYYKTDLTTNYYYPSYTKTDSLGHIRNGIDKMLRTSIVNSWSISKKFAGSKDNISFSIRQYAYTINKEYRNVNAFPVSMPDYNQSNELKFDEFAVQFDLQTFKLFKAKIDAGIKYTGRQNNSTFSSEKFNEQSNLFELDTSFNASNNFDSHQKITAIYAAVSKRLNNKFSFDIGNRLEYTINRIGFGNLFKVKANYFTYLLNASVLHVLTNELSLQVSFSKRISRPGITYLNPFLNIGRDSRNLSQGNPALKPEIVYRTEIDFSYTKENFFISLSPYWTFRNDLIATKTMILSGDTLISKLENLNIARDYGISINGSKTLWKNIKMNLSLGAEKNYILTENKKKSGSNYYFNAGLSYALPKNILFWGSYQSNSALMTFQGKDPSTSSIQLAIKKLFFNKLSITVSASDFIDKNSLRKYITDNNGIYQSISNNTYQKLYSIVFKYEFGKIKNRSFTSSRINSNDLKDDK